MRGRFWLTFWMAIGAIAALLSPGTAAAGLAGPSLSVCVARAAPGMTPDALFADPGRFDCATPQRDFGAGDFWALSQPLPAGRFAVVRMSSVWQDRVTLYVRYTDGAIRQVAFTSADTGRLLRLVAAIQVDIPDRAAPAQRLLWHIEGAGNIRGIVLGPVVATHEGTDHAQFLLALFYAAILGGAGSLLIHNLALLTVLRQPFQAVYCGLLMFLLLYTLSVSGLLGHLMPGLDNNDRQRLNWLMLGLCGAAIVLFARLFFERRVFAGWLGRVSEAVMAALVGTGLLAAVLAPSHIILLHYLITASFVTLMVLVPLVIVRAWRTRSRYLGLFALAWSVPIVMAGLRIAQAVGLTGWHFWLDQSTVLSMMAEALISSLAITFRLRMLQQQRDAARAGEAIARAVADTDPLTGLANRRAFMRQAIGRAGAQTLFVIDLDHFKTINDTIGHDGGDEVLRTVAGVLEAIRPAGGLVARIGGEEFALIFDRHVGLSPATLFDALRSARMPFDVIVTASIGISSGPLVQETDWKALYRRADRALYAAKAAGRDRARDADALQMAA